MKKQLTIKLDIDIPAKYDLKMLETDLKNLRAEILHFFREDSYIDLVVDSSTMEVTDMSPVENIIRTMPVRFPETFKENGIWRDEDEQFGWGV